MVGVCCGTEIDGCGTSDIGATFGWLDVIGCIAGALLLDSLAAGSVVSFTVDSLGATDVDVEGVTTGRGWVAADDVTGRLDVGAGVVTTAAG